jgi:hypothetical protein
MMQLVPVVAQEPIKEGTARKPQSPFQKWGESNNFPHIFIRMIFSQGRTPLNNRSESQKTLLYQRFQVGLGTLTCVPAFLLSWFRSHILPLDCLLGHHPKIHGTLHAHTMAETLGWGWEAQGEQEL